jgi:hypothetical protein
LLASRLASGQRLDAVGNVKDAIGIEYCPAGAAMVFSAVIAVTLVTFVTSLAMGASEPVSLALLGVVLSSTATVARRAIDRISNRQT